MGCFLVDLITRIKDSEFKPIRWKWFGQLAIHLVCFFIIANTFPIKSYKIEILKNGT